MPTPLPASRRTAAESVPGELFIRPASLADAAAIRDLVNEVDLVDTGSEVGYTEEEAGSDLRQVADLTSDSWLAVLDGELVAYAVLWPASSGLRFDVDHYVLPRHLQIGAQLLDLLTARAAELAAAAGVPADLQLALTPDSVLAVHALPVRGWHNVRRHHVLTRPVSVQDDPPPFLPEGIAIRSVRTAEDQEIAYRLIQDTFAGHFGFEPSTYPDWKKRVDADNRDWSLCWIASQASAADPLARPRDIGVCLAHNDREATGWVQNLGTLAATRQRGVGAALLRTAFAEFAKRGQRAVGLGVDTGNVNNALRFYTNLGFTLQFAADTWQLVVQPSLG
jgi:mycothiol synthase